MIATVDEAKFQCRLDLDSTLEDEYLADLIAAAHEASEHFTDRRIFATQAELDAALAADPDLRHPIVATPTIKRAVLFFVGHWYANRESVITGATVAEIPASHEFLLYPSRVLGNE